MKSETHRCIRCGRLLHRWHYVITSDNKHGYMCVDDRSCHQRQPTRKQKQLLDLKKRWAE